MAFPIVPKARIQQYKDALLNTCVKRAQPYFEEGALTMRNCRESDDFKEVAVQWLEQPLFTRSIEPAMEMARNELLRELTPYVDAYATAA